MPSWHCYCLPGIGWGRDKTVGRDRGGIGAPGCTRLCPQKPAAIPLQAGAPTFLSCTQVKGGREKYGAPKTMPVWKTERTAKYAKYANPEAGGGNIRLFAYFAVTARCAGCPTVAQVSKPAVPPTSKSARAGFPGARRLGNPRHSRLGSLRYSGLFAYFAYFAVISASWPGIWEKW